MTGILCNILRVSMIWKKVKMFCKLFVIYCKVDIVFYESKCLDESTCLFEETTQNITNDVSR